MFPFERNFGGNVFPQYISVKLTFSSVIYKIPANNVMANREYSNHILQDVFEYWSNHMNWNFPSINSQRFIKNNVNISNAKYSTRVD